MSRTKNDKNIMFFGVLVVGLLVLIACVCVCFLHVWDLKNSYQDEVESNFERHISVGAQVVEDHMNQTLTTAVNAAEELGNLSINQDRIYSILQKYQKVDNLSEITYIEPDGMTYFPEGVKGVETVGADLEFVMQGEAFSQVSIRYQADGSNGTLVAVAPVRRGDEMCGAIVAVKSLQGMLEERAFEYLGEAGQVFLVDKSGEILDRSISEEGFMCSDKTNVLDCLSEEMRPSEANRVVVRRIEMNLGKEAAEKEKIQLKDGSKVYVMVRAIEGVGRLYFVECYPESLFMEKVEPVVRRSLISCFVIILLMASIVFVIWYYLKKNNEVIRRLAYLDAITGGRNFNYFLDKAILLIRENREIPYVVHRFDISNFRYINEAYGHTRADELLKIVISVSGQVFTQNELCVRMNADQFAVLAVNSEDYLSRIAVFEDNINNHAMEIGIKFPIKLKSGIYRVRRGDHDISVMVDRANVARKSLSSDSKEMSAYYSDKIINNMRKIDKIESEQQQALVNGEFKVYLQPKWDIYKDELYGAEALVRWIKDDGTMVYPDAFIPIFEQNGFIEQLDFYMLGEVCAHIKKMIDEGKKPFPISVNQSRRLWDNPNYAENVERVIAKYGIPSEYVDLEVTETVFFGEKDRMLAVISELKQTHVLLSMDDFGSGYSSLNLLKDLPVDILKIDREFFSESIASKSSTWILKKIVEMAEGLGIHVLCEGVETLEQVMLLRDLGCQYVQGYYYSKPIPIKDFMAKYVS